MEDFSTINIKRLEDIEDLTNEQIYKTLHRMVLVEIRSALYGQSAHSISELTELLKTIR